MLRGEFRRQDVADLIRNLLTVDVDLLAGQILVLRHVGQNRLNAFGHAAGNLVNLFILLFLGFLGCLGKRIVGLDLLRDCLGQLVHPVRVHLRDLLLRHEDIRGALLNRILEQCVDRVDLPAGFLSGGFEIRAVLLPHGGDLLLLAGGRIFDRFQDDKECDCDYNCENNDREELIFQFLQHGRFWG